mgnify:CR=1 FL=1
MPLSLDLAHRILQVLADIRREGKVMTYLRPDAKSQVTIEYDDNGTPVRIDTIVVSTQHDDFIQPENDSEAAQLKADEEMLSIIRRDVIEILMPRVIASSQHLQNTVCQIKRKRHVVFRFVRCITEHHTLVACTLFHRITPVRK